MHTLVIVYSKIRELMSGAFITALIFAIAYFTYLQMEKALNKEPFVSNITLKNNCTVSDEVFTVVTIPSSKRGYFSNGETKLKVFPNWKIKLDVNTKYNDFVYDGIEHPAKKNLVLKAECDDGLRKNEIFNSLNQQFK